MERTLHLHDKWVVELAEDLVLNFDAGHLVSFDHKLLLDYFHGVKVLGEVVLDLVDFTVRSSANDRNFIEVVFCHARL